MKSPQISFINVSNFRKIRNLFRENCIKTIDLVQSLCEKINPLIDPLAEHMKINVFGYRKFFADGTSFDTSSSFAWTKFVQEKFNGKIIPNYETEVAAALQDGKRFFLRIGKPTPQDLFLSTLYECDVWNTLSLYCKGDDSVDAFYFTSTRDNFKIVDTYINQIDLFENFAFYFKDKLNGMITPQDLKKVSSPTISSSIFEENNPIVTPKSTVTLP